MIRVFSKKIIFQKFIALSLLAIVSGCQRHTFKSNEAFIKYLGNPDNGYLHSRTVNDIDVSIFYRPTEHLLIRSLKTDCNEKCIDSIRNIFESYKYFNVGLSKNDREVETVVPSSRVEYSELTNALSFEMEDKVYIMNNRDTIRPISVVQPRTYGKGSKTTFLVGFPLFEASGEGNDIKFILEDFGLQTGRIVFPFKKEIFKRQLVLDFKI